MKKIACVLKCLEAHTVPGFGYLPVLEVHTKTMLKGWY